MIAKLKNSLKATSAFVISKASVFLIPLWFSDVLSTAEYGQFEYALSLAMIFGTALNFGSNLSYPIIVLRKDYVHLNEGFDLQKIINVVILILGFFLIHFTDLPLKYSLGLILGFVISNQLFYASKFKTEGRNSLGTLVESGHFLLGFFAAFFAMIMADSKELFGFYYWIVTGYAIIWSVIAIQRIIKVSKNRVFLKYKALMSFGKHIFLSGLLSILIAMFGKLAIEYLLGDEPLGIYSFFFRIISGVVVLYQLVNLLLFRDLFKRSISDLDNLFKKILFGLLGLNLLLLLVYPFVLPMLFNKFELYFIGFEFGYLMTGIYVMSWICSALLEGIVNREGISSKNNLFNGIILGLFVVSVVLIKVLNVDVSLIDVISIHTLMSLLINFSQVNVIYRKTSHLMKMVLLFLSLLTLLLITLYFAQ